MKKVLNLLQYASDIHLERNCFRHIQAKKPYLLLGGDIGYPHQKVYKDFLYNISGNFDKIFLLSGNHEYDNVHINEIKRIDDDIRDICSVKTNIYFLQKEVQKLCYKENISIAGCTLWSKKPITKGLIHQDHAQWLKKITSENKDTKYVIATHHCPLFECINPIYKNTLSNYFASDQSNILKQKNVLGWIHGHNHENKDFVMFNKPILSNQYGYTLKPLPGFKNSN